MKIVQKIIAFMAAFSFLVILLITATEGAIYSDFQYYQKEYEKYEVLDDLNMTMEDAMHVTNEMMAYLKGDRDRLEVITQVDGKEQDFFNEQDRFHMAEVRDIFCEAIRIRWIAVGIFVLCLIMLLFFKMDWMRWISLSYMGITGGLTFGVAILAFFMYRNFNQCFVIFHEIFFDNDLWMFDPKTDYMIRMLPEGLFSDFANRIGIFAGVTMFLFLLVSIMLHKRAKRQT